MHFWKTRNHLIDHVGTGVHYGIIFIHPFHFILHSLDKSILSKTGWCRPFAYIFYFAIILLLYGSSLKKKKNRVSVQQVARNEALNLCQSQVGSAMRWSLLVCDLGREPIYHVWYLCTARFDHCSGKFGVSGNNCCCLSGK